MTLQRVTVQRVRAAATTARDAHGNRVKAAPTAMLIPRCDVQPGAAPEVLGNRDTTGIVWTVFAHGWVDVVSTDRIYLPGDAQPYEVDGEPLHWPAGLSLSAQTIIALRAWKEP